MPDTQSDSYPIGFRRAWTPWQRDLSKVVRWAVDNSFPHMDFGPIAVSEAKEILNAGLKIASVDLQNWSELCTADTHRRTAAVEANARYVREMTSLGVTLFLAVLVPAEPHRTRRENFDFAASAYRDLCEAIESTDAKIVLEGAPGKPPHFGSLACTPADLRAFRDAVHSPALGVNFDPSHLVRMGIDPVRFLREFGGLIHHVHAKDVIFDDEALYQHGNLQAATLASPHKFGGHHWRYALPGRGVVNWRSIFKGLGETGYRGRISIELEDETLNDDEMAEKNAMIEARSFLSALATG